MNIKRAFLTAVALLVVPGFALAQSTVTFNTTVATTDGSDVTINAALTCNTGDPLNQSFNISPGSGVNFVVSNVIADANTACGVTFSNLPANYTVDAINTNGTASATAPHCNWDQGNLVASNSCQLVLAPGTFTYSVVMDWDVPAGSGTELNATVAWSCNNVATSEGGALGSQSGTFFFTGPDTTTQSVSSLYADSNGSSTCSASASSSNSAIEFTPGCSGQSVGVGATVTCAITATVFFEGIPTLSQYGLAIMALLMLGVGFIGFRRFV